VPRCVRGSFMAKSAPPDTMTFNDPLGALILFAVGLGAVAWGVLGTTFRRRRSGTLDPHPTRVRFALIALGLATLLLFFSEYVAPRVLR